MPKPTDQVTTILASYPGPVTLQQNRYVPIGLTIGGGLWAIAWLLLAIIGVGDAEADFGRPQQIFMGLLFAACGLFAILFSFRNIRRPKELLLDVNGFQMISPGGADTFSWHDVHDFRKEIDEGTSSTVFEVTRLQRHGRNAKHHLIDNFGLSHDDLVFLMEQWRAKALTR